MSAPPPAPKAAPKPTQVIAIFNQAGGVGKTTLVLHLAHQLAKHGHRVLAIDLDPQGSLGAFLGYSPDLLDLAQGDLLSCIQNPDSATLRQRMLSFGFALVPGGLALAEMDLTDTPPPTDALARILARSPADYILIDCPPSLGRLSLLALTAARHLLIPVQPQFKAFLGTDLLLGTVARIRRGLNPGLSIAAFVPTLVDLRNSQDKRALAAMKEQMSEIAPVLEAIPRSTAFADASERRIPLHEYEPKHPAIATFRTIARFLERLA